MALYKGTQKYTTTIKPSTKNIQPLTVSKNGTYSAPTGVDGFNPVIMKNNNTFCAMGSHTDSNGVWHRPEEWDDIESIDLGDRQEVYFLCACHKNEYNWFRIRAYGSGMTWSYGHVSNGVYTLHTNSTETSVANAGSISLFLNNIVDDYIVVRLKATTSINSCGYYDWAADANMNYAVAYRCQPVLMRYGRMPKGTSLQRSATYYLESDNILDFAKDYQNTTTAITVSDAYSSAYSLQRWRYTGWDLAKNKITTFANMFYYCYCLCDVPDPIDCSNWVTSNVTSLSSMFHSVTSMNTHILVYNWDLTNVTTMANLFYISRSLKSIEGTETWTSAPKCTNTSSMFSNCCSITNKIDVSNCYFGNGTANLTTVNNMFDTLSSCPEINISNMNLSKVTSMGAFLNAERNCKKLTMNNVTAPTSTCTNYNNVFSNTAIGEIIIDGWNFSGSGTNTGQTMLTSSYGLKKLIFRNCIAPSNTINDTVAQFNIRYSYNLEYLDISFLDMSVFSNTITHAQSFRDLINLVDFYPPQNISKSFNLTNDLQLSHDSLMRVINNLITVSTTQTLTIGAYNLWKLSAEEKAIATNKGWTLA